MNFAGHLAIIQLMIQSPEYTTDFVQIAISDSTTLSLGQTITPLSNGFPSYMKQRTMDLYIGIEEYDKKAFVQEGVLGIDNKVGKAFKIKEQDVIIMNPPFTKKQTMVNFSPDYRKELLKRFSDYSNILSKSSKYCYFFLILAHKLLSENGKLAFVLPTTFLRGKDAKDLREWFLNNYYIQYIILRKDKPNFSEDTSFRECLFISQKLKGSSNKKSSIIFLKTLNSNVAQQIKAINS